MGTRLILRDYVTPQCLSAEPLKLCYVRLDLVNSPQLIYGLYTFLSIRFVRMFATHRCLFAVNEFIASS